MHMQTNITSNCHNITCRGLYITIHDLDHVYEVLCNWPAETVKVSNEFASVKYKHLELKVCPAVL